LVDYPFSRPALGSWPILILAMLAARQSASQPERPIGEAERVTARHI